MKKFKDYCMMFLALVLLSGCASKINPFMGTNLPLENSNSNQPVMIMVDQPPVMTIGVPLMDYSRAQEFIIPISDELLENEFHIFRESFMVIGIDETGNVYPGVVILKTKQKNSVGKFWGNGKVFAPKRAGIKIFILSTRAKYFFGKGGIQIPVERQRLADRSYTASLWHNGESLEGLYNPDMFDFTISLWKNRRTPFGNLKTPESDETINSVAVINTGYSVDERRNRDRRNVLSTNPYGMAISWGIDIYEEVQEQRGVVETSGWDFDSPLSEGEKEFIKQYLDGLREAAKIIDYSIE